MLSSVLGSEGMWAQKIPSWALGTAVWLGEKVVGYGKQDTQVFLFLMMGVTLKLIYPIQTVLIIGWSCVDWSPVAVTRYWAGSLGGVAQCAGLCHILVRRLLQFRLCPEGGSTDRYKMGSLQEVQGRGSLAELGAGKAD